MDLDQEFHELFFIPDVPKKSRFADRSRLRQRVGKNHADHNRYYNLKSLNVYKSGKDKKSKSKSRESPSATVQTITDPPILELNSNPSSFKVFAAIRQAVIESKLRNESLFFIRSLQGFNNCDDVNDDSDPDDSSKDSPIKVCPVTISQLLTTVTNRGHHQVPKVVALGLCVVFELIRESRFSNPGLCSRALQALLDSLQGQSPEGLKKEPPDVTSSLFELLLDLSIASSSSDHSSTGDHRSDGDNVQQADAMVGMMRSFACSSLLSLAISIGDTGKILKAINCLLTSSSSSSSNNFKLEQIETPSILISCQKSVQAVILGKTSRPEWSSHGFPATSFCDSFQFNPVKPLPPLPGDDPSTVPSGDDDEPLNSDDANDGGHKNSSLVFDGKYLYLLNHQHVLYKIGSGFGGTSKGQVIKCRQMSNSNNSSKSKRTSMSHGWIGWIQGYLYYQPNNWSRNELIKLDCDTLNEVANVTLGITSWCPSLAASDGDYLLLISTVKDDGFILRTLKPSTSSPSSANEVFSSSSTEQQLNSGHRSSPLSTYLMPVVNEVPLKLAHKCLVVCGGSSSSSGVSLFDASPSLTPLDQQSSTQTTSELVSDMSNNRQQQQLKLKQILATEEDIAQVCSGKDFALIRTVSGKVLYSGRGQSLGIKHGSSSGRWTTLPISKSPKITSISVGHEAAHVLLVSEDGSVYFCGVSKRGEDGDLGRGSSRRQPKAVKPRKITRMDGKNVAACSSNYGTSALVTRDGELFMFGKDTNHVDRSSGLVSSLKNVVITSVSLGKAHGLALSNKGAVYSFGLNHKGQCGHDFIHLNASSSGHQPSPLSTVSSGALIESSSSEVGAVGDSAVDISEDLSESVCPAGNHRWIYDQCMICTSCGNCTGYGAACVARMKSEVRNPGLPCGCGVGDSGCVDCGMCKSCDKLAKDSIQAAMSDDPGHEDAVAVAIPVAAANGGPINLPPFDGAAFQNIDHRDGGQWGVFERPQNEGRRRHPAQFQDANNVINPRDVAESALRAAIMASEAAADIRNVHVAGGQYFKQVWRRNAIEAYLGRKFRHLGRSYRNDHGHRGGVDNIGQQQQQLPEHVPINPERINPIGGQPPVPLSGNNYLHHQLDEASTGSDCETTKLTSLPPTKLNLSAKVVQVCCGIHHSVLLTESGDVWTFGSNQQGQLGLGDFVMRDKPSKVSIPNVSIIQIAAGSNHTVLLSSTGHVYTFGSNSKGQLARLPSAIDYNWNSTPHRVPNIGPQFGRRATWIEASGDHTFIKFDESLINPLSLTSVKIIADSKCVVLCPSSSKSSSSSESIKKLRPQSSLDVDDVSMSSLHSSSSAIKSLVINRSDGSCRVFSDPDQIDLSSFSANCLDDFYDTLWSFDSSTSTFHRHNIVAVESKKIQLLDTDNQQSNLGEDTKTNTYPLILSPEIVLPNKSGFSISRSNAALNLLCSLHTLTRAHQLGLSVFDDDPVKNQVAKTYSKEDFSSVNRFESHGGGWGYSGHSIEAIRFSCDADVLLGGLGLFGGRGEYLAKLRIYDIGNEGGDQEGDGEIVAETEETPFECGSRQKYPVIFEEPVPIIANRWYVAWARVSGPSSDCGSSGQSIVNTDDQVTFYFKSSKKSNNGTDVNAGQIPLILYKLMSPGDPLNHTSNPGFGSKCSNNRNPSVNPVTILSRSFSMSVSVECFTSLLKLLKWSWSSFKVLYIESPSTRPPASTALEGDLKHLSYICCATLYLLKVYVNEVFPSINKKQSTSFYSSDISRIAECVGDTRTLIKAILMDAKPSMTTAIVTASMAAINNNDPGPSVANMLMNQILTECQSSFTNCYHAFYPSANLRWRGLCDLLLPDGSSAIDEEPERTNEHFLSAMFASLSSPLIRLTLTFPINMDINNSSSSGTSTTLSPVASMDIASPTGSVDSVTIQDPILVEKMTEKSDREECHSGTNCSFKDILNKLLVIVGQPVECLIVSQQRLELEKLEDSLEGEPLTPLTPQLVANTCKLLSSVVSELVAQSTGLGLDFQLPVGQSFQVTPSRFSRVSQNRTWNTGNGTPDAISFTVDKTGILIAGVTVYGGSGNEWNYELEILEYNDSPNESCTQSQNLQYTSIDAVRGTYSLDDKSSADVTSEIKFERPIPVRDNVKYALRLRNYGARTNNGDGGLTRVQGPDGTTFTFSDCPLSFNGTNHTRGQIPQILYYSSPPSMRSTGSDHKKVGDEVHARKSVLSISESVIGLAVELLKESQDFLDHQTLKAISSSQLISNLLPSILSSLVPVSSNDPESVFQIMTLIRKILPLVVKLNKFLEHQVPNDVSTECPSDDETLGHESSNCLIKGSASTTSNHYVIVESDHPYKPASVYHYKVSFPSNVKWMSIEFDPKCATAQQEDSLQLYVPSNSKCKNSSRTSSESSSSPSIGSSSVSNDYWPVFSRFKGPPLSPLTSTPLGSGSENNVAVGNWPSKLLILPGSEMIFSLETASDYIKDDKSSFFGFKVQVIGYESPLNAHQGMQLLEEELIHLGVTCLTSLLARNLILPPSSAFPDTDSLIEDDDVSAAVKKAFKQSNVSRVSSTTGQGSSSQLFDTLNDTSSSLFSSVEKCIKDSYSSSSEVGKLAQWLQLESQIDTNTLELDIRPSFGDHVKVGQPSKIIVTMKDQFGEAVSTSQLKVDLSIQQFLTHFSTSNDQKSNQNNENLPLTTTSTTSFLPSPQTKPYIVTVKEKLRYHAITMMQPYDGYSFEELRYLTPVAKPSAVEKLTLNCDPSSGLLTCSWTPSVAGWFQVKASVCTSSSSTSEPSPAVQTVQVIGEDVSPSELENIDPSPNVAPTVPSVKSKCRRFIVRESAGLRVRSLPSLQSEQIGTIPFNEDINFIDETENDDGTWVRLSSESIKKFCPPSDQSSQLPTEAWCLQFNQHIGRPLLVAIENIPSSESIKKNVHKVIDDRLETSSSQKLILQTSKTSSISSSISMKLPCLYHVIKCGPAGHNIRSRSTVRSPVVGKLSLGNTLTVVQELKNIDGQWLKLSEESKKCYCYDIDGDAWALASIDTGLKYLQSEAEMMAMDTQSSVATAAKSGPLIHSSSSVVDGHEDHQNDAQHVLKEPFMDRDPSSDLSLISDQAENVFEASSITSPVPIQAEVSTIVSTTTSNGEVVAPSSPISSRKSFSSAIKSSSPCIKVSKRPASSSSLTGSTIKYPCVYRVMKCGPSGHNVRSKPMLRSPVVGQLVLGCTITVVEEVKNIDGIWLKLSEESKKSFCYNPDGDAWTLASIDLESEAARRTYALQALTWLLKNVTQPVALHDILWSFVSALSLKGPSNSNQTSTQNLLNQNQPSSLSLESIKENGFPADGRSMVQRDSITMIDHSIINQDMDGQGSGVVLRRDSNNVPVRVNNPSNVPLGHGAESQSSVENMYSCHGGVCYHPCSDLNAAGDSVRAVRQSFHSFLESVSALMPNLPPSSPLQQMAMKCFYLHFEPADHAFLHRCHVFSNISRILSKSEEEQTSAATSINESSPAKSKLLSAETSKEVLEQEEEGANIEVLMDMTLQVDIKSSSRQAMIGSLTDSSTETFWESGDEDRNRTKVVTISTNAVQNLEMVIIYIHIDNCRDLGSKISHVCFKSSTTAPCPDHGSSLSNIAEASSGQQPSKASPVDPRPSASNSMEGSLPVLPSVPSVNESHSTKIKSVDVDNRFSGWLSCNLPSSAEVGGAIKSVKIELKGPDNTLRLRQVKVLGLDRSASLPGRSGDKKKYQQQQPSSASSTLSRKAVPRGPSTAAAVGGVCNYSQIQQINCEAETLKVFRLLTSQVFGKLITGEEDSSSRRESTVMASTNNQQQQMLQNQSTSSGSNPGNTVQEPFGSSSTENLNESRKASTSSTGGAGGEESNDLREHMVGILFSRSSKLSHLQKQICSHIVQAIRVEADRVREEWESLLCSPPPPTTTSTGSVASAQTFVATSPNQMTSNERSSTQIPSDSYCFEMLSMVLALSGSTIGRQYLSQQSGLVLDLFSLLHTGSARVQRQVTALLRRVLPEIAPSSLASLLKVKRLPPVDFMKSVSCTSEEPFDPHDSGILDVFLSCIAKALTVQTKVKGGSMAGRGGSSSNVPHQSSSSSGKSIMSITLATAIHPRDNLRDRWWLRGCMSRKLAEVIMALLRDMSAGKLSETWASVTRGAISENIINLTRLPESLRSSNECLKSPTLWIALASLCVLDPGHAERLSSSSRWLRQPNPNLSSGQLPSSSSSPGTASNATASGDQTVSLPSRPFCDNHDDNETLAIILCTVCGNLCAECDRFLHLHRKTKNHQRQIFKEEEEAIKVDLHEGCGRIKLFWLMALADSRQLKAMVEFRGSSPSLSSTNILDQQQLMSRTSRTMSGGQSFPQSGTNMSGCPLLLSSPSSLLLGPLMTGICRFCGVTGNTGLLAIGNVCSESECQEYSRTACTKTLPCGHVCGGVRDEESCLPCLHGCDPQSSNLKQDADDMCMICFTEALSAAPAIGLKCGHVFHLHCCQAIISKRWPGPRITFTFSLCPICKHCIDHPMLEELLKPVRSLFEDVKKKAGMRLEYEGLHRSDAITSPGGRFFNDPAGYAMERYAYYVCSKCSKAYYGGEARCDAEAGIGDDYDPNELVCGGCSDVSRAQMCPKHGTDFLEYKCRYCCSVAVFFCFGTTHFCNPCHDDFQRVTNVPKKDLPKCPVGPRARQLEGSECPLHVVHPPTGEEFALGCGVCRNAHTF